MKPVVKQPYKLFRVTNYGYTKFHLNQYRRTSVRLKYKHPIILTNFHIYNIIWKDRIQLIKLYYNGGKTTPPGPSNARQIFAYLQMFIMYFTTVGTYLLIVSDSIYFTKQTKTFVNCLFWYQCGKIIVLVSKIVFFFVYKMMQIFKMASSYFLQVLNQRSLSCIGAVDAARCLGTCESQPYNGFLTNFKKLRLSIRFSFYVSPELIFTRVDPRAETY